MSASKGQQADPPKAIYPVKDEVFGLYKRGKQLEGQATAAEFTEQHKKALCLWMDANATYQTLLHQLDKKHANYGEILNHTKDIRKRVSYLEDCREAAKGLKTIFCMIVSKNRIEFPHFDFEFVLTN